MFCPECGSQISKYAPRCPECSARIPKNLKSSVEQFETGTQGSNPAAIPGHKSNARYVETKLLGQWVIGLLMANVIILLLSVGLDFSMINYARNSLNGFPPPVVEFDEFWLRVIAESILAGITYICASVMFLVWLHRVHGNLEALGVRNFNFDSTWIIGWWFIPLANYVKPGQAVGDIWRASDPNLPFGTEWRMGQTSNIVTLWWISFVMASVIGSLAVLMMVPEDPESLLSAGHFRLTADITRIIGGFLAMTVVGGINDRQTQKAAVTGVWPPIG